MSDAELESQARAVDRMTFFSDAVVAIAITLLAIDLPAPTGATVPEFLSSARHNSGHYLAFLISFLAISAAWSHHHEIFRYSRQMDRRLRTLNTTWLLTIILIPFATRLLTSRGGISLGVHALRFGFYALLQAIGALLMLVIVRHIVSRRQAPGIPASAMSRGSWQTLGLLLGFGLSIPVLFLTPYGWVLWFVMPLLVRQLYRFRGGADRSPGVT